MDATLIMGKQGRIVIPASMRAALGMEPGDRLHVRLTGARLVVERGDDAAVHLRGFATEHAGSRSLVDELIAERRAAADRE